MQNTSTMVKTQSLNLDEILSVTHQPMQRVNEFIIENLSSDISLINLVSRHIINSGGKRLRPALLLLSADACGNKRQDNIPLAAIIEYIHTATLLHDDVVDESSLRRGRETVNSIWGNQASVLVGDFLYSRAFQQMVSLNNMRIMEILASTTNMIAEGEVLQLMGSHNHELTESQYLETIHRKTAILFKAACQLGAVISQAPFKIETALSEYGINLGMAFQIVDDILDYTGDSEKTGKNVGDDLVEGKVTLPFIYAYHQVSEKDKLFMKQVIEKQPNEDEVYKVIDIVTTTGAINKTRKLALDYTEKASHALLPLANSSYKQAMHCLVDYLTTRHY